MMTVNEVSDYLSLSPRSVYRLLGDLPAIRVGGRWRFRVSDVEQWLLKQRTASEPQIEPVEEIGSKLRLFSHMEEGNVFLDLPQTDASSLIRYAIDHARLALIETPGSDPRQQIFDSIMERESLCSTALHREVAFPHPRDPEKCPLASDQIVVVRAAQPVDFREINGYRPRVAFLLLARTASLQLLWEARLSHLLHQEGFLQKLLAARTPHELYQLFPPPDQRGRRPETAALQAPPR